MCLQVISGNLRVISGNFGFVSPLPMCLQVTLPALWLLGCRVPAVVINGGCARQQACRQRGRRENHRRESDQRLGHHSGVWVDAGRAVTGSHRSDTDTRQGTQPTGLPQASWAWPSGVPSITRDYPRLPEILGVVGVAFRSARRAPDGREGLLS